MKRNERAWCSTSGTYPWSMGFTYPIPDRWRMCTISYSIPRWWTAISCGQCQLTSKSSFSIIMDSINMTNSPGLVSESCHKSTFKLIRHQKKKLTQLFTHLFFLLNIQKQHTESIIYMSSFRM
jgi:hypothetical protein